MKRLFAAAALIAAFGMSASAQDSGQSLTPGHLSASVTPTHYEITVTPDAANLTLAGQVRIDLNVAARTREIVLNALELSFDHVELDGQTPQDITYDAPTQTARLVFARPVGAGAHALNIAYRGRIYRAAQGMFAVDYDAHGAQERALYTQFEASDARRFVPSFDEPLLKAVFQLNVVAPENRMVVSNMPAASTEHLAGGLQRVHFQPSPRMSSYLMFVGVGDFERIHQDVNGVDVGVIVKRGDTESGRFALESAAQILPYYNDYFGTPYPLPKMDLIAGPGGGGFGAMENWGAIFYFERALLVNPAISSEGDRQSVFGTIAHEMAHQWFGDLVTMDWWDDIWLNEGFATWMANKAAEHFHPTWNAWLRAQDRRQQAMNQDARATSHSIVQRIDTVDQANQAFDNITYRKGAAIIRMVETYVGADAFRDGVRAYMIAHNHANARTADLWDAIEHASTRPMRQMADEFTHQPGVPLITVEPGACVNGGRMITFRQGRFGTDEPSQAPLRWQTPLSATLLSGPPHVPSGITDDSGVARLHLDGCGAFVVNPGQTSYFRVAYSRAAFQQLATSLPHVDAMDQYGLLADARALGETDVAPYTDFFILSQRMPANGDAVVWELIAADLLVTDSLYDGRPNATLYRTFARSQLRPVFARVGWDRRAGEPDNNAVLREKLIGALGELEDPLVVAEARRRFVAGALPGATRQATLDVVGENQDAAMFETLLQRAKTSTATLEKTSYYVALAHAHDPALAERALSHAFDDDLDASLGPRMIETVAINHPDIAWRFAQAHQAELSTRLDPLQRVQFMPGLLANANDPALLTELRNFIDTSVPQELRRNPEQRYLELAQRLRVRTEKLPQLDAWLPGRRS